MLKRIYLAYQLTKFYNQFSEVLGYGYDSIKPSYLKHTGFLTDVQFAINEILEANSNCFCEDAYELDVWLRKLYLELDALQVKKDHINKVLFHICNTKKHGFYQLRWGTRPIYKFAQWLYKKGV